MYYISIVNFSLFRDYPEWQRGWTARPSTAKINVITLGRTRKLTLPCTVVHAILDFTIFAENPEIAQIDGTLTPIDNGM